MTTITWKTILAKVCKAQSNTQLDELFEELAKKNIKFALGLEDDMRKLSNQYNRIADVLYKQYK